MKKVLSSLSIFFSGSLGASLLITKSDNWRLWLSLFAITTALKIFVDDK